MIFCYWKKARKKKIKKEKGDLMNCSEILGLDIENILELSSYMNNLMDKLYEVVITKHPKIELKRLIIFAVDEDDALEKLNKYMNDNYIYDLSKYDNIEYTITKISEDFLLETEENFEEFGNEVREGCCKNKNCLNCKYRCSVCGRCTYWRK